MTLTKNKIPRIITLCALYFAQGMPYGFLTFLLMPYLSEQGKTSEQIGSLGFIATIPWMIKFLWGPLVDSFTGSAMGRRRPWIIFAQGSMLVVMGALIFIPNVLDNLTVMLVLIFVINLFGSLQDVSVDALAVEALEEDERAFVNGLMFGCASGGAVFVSGVVVAVMAKYGIREALMVQCAVLFIVMLLPLYFREREGEKFLPFTKGQAAEYKLAGESESAPETKGQLIQNIAKAFSIRSAILMLLLTILVKIGVELHGIVANTFYIQDMGWAFEEFGKRGVYVESATLLSCFAGGYLADKFGHKRMAILGCMLFGLSYITFALNPALWSNHLYVKIFFMVEGGFYGIISVSLFAMCMDISFKAVAGTQFTAYMAMMNGSAAIGKLFAGKFDNLMDYKGILIFWGVFQMTIIPFLLLFIDPHERKKSEELGINIYTRGRKIRALCAIALVFIFLMGLVCYKILFDKVPPKKVDQFVNKSEFLIEDTSAIDSYDKIFSLIEDKGLDITDASVGLEQADKDELLKNLVVGAKSKRLGLPAPTSEQSSSGDYIPKMQMVIKMYDIFVPLLEINGTKKEQVIAFMAFGEQLCEYDRDIIISIKGVQCKQKAYNLLRQYLTEDSFVVDDESIKYTELQEEIQGEFEKLETKRKEIEAAEAEAASQEGTPASAQ